MATIPPARPSRPSIRLTALAMSTTHTTVNRADMFDERITVSKKGIRSTTSDTPTTLRTTPATTMPATLAGTDSGEMSSTTPTAQITAAATSTPIISDGAANTDAKSPSSQAVAAPTNRPNSIAVPPSVAVGDSWTLRSSGATRTPDRVARRRATGVAAAVATAAAPPTRAKASPPGRSSDPVTLIGPSAPVRREPTTQFDHLGPHGVDSGIVVNAAEGTGNQVGDDGHLGFTHPLGRG